MHQHKDNMECGNSLICICVSLILLWQIYNQMLKCCAEHIQAMYYLRLPVFRGEFNAGCSLIIIDQNELYLSEMTYLKCSYVYIYIHMSSLIFIYKGKRLLSSYDCLRGLVSHLVACFCYHTFSLVSITTFCYGKF